MEAYNDVEILLVEDNPSDGELTIRALKKNKLTNNIVWVKDGEEALDFIFCKNKFAERKTNPKVILLDLKLPKVDGLKVLEEVKKNDATQEIPVVVLTSSKEERDIVDSYKLGVNSYIVKPVDFDKFVQAVADIGLYWLLMNQKPTQ